MDEELNLTTQKKLQFLRDTEAAAQDVLISKQDIIALDHRRQKTREALWALKKDERANGATWVSVGSLFVKIRSDKAKELLQRDMTVHDQEINETRTKLKEQVKKLRDLEGHTDLRGFDLKPITKEAQAIIDAFSK